MKKSLFSLLLLSILASAKLVATTRIVNNTTPAPGQFATIAAAITAAAAGDTILVAGSVNSYGSFTINKNNLVFIGNGHNPQKTPSLSTTADVITLAANLNGCKIQGFNLDRVNHSVGNPNVDNVSIEFCFVRSQIEVRGNNNNWTIKNCIFNCGNCNAIEGYSETGRTNVIIANNVFSSGNRVGNFQGGNTGILITNNVFLKGVASDNGVFNGVDNAVITNNIFYQHSPTGNQFNNTYSNNISYLCSSNALPPSCGGCGGTGNLVGVDPMFTTYTSGQNFNAATQNFILQLASPGHNTGTDGTDMGVYGNGNTFSETGEPPVPTIRVMNISNPNTAVGATLNFNVTAGQPDPDQ